MPSAGQRHGATRGCEARASDGLGVARVSRPVERVRKAITVRMGRETHATRTKASGLGQGFQKKGHARN